MTGSEEPAPKEKTPQPARGEHVSDFVRRAIRRELASLSFCTEETKKALGMGAQMEMPGG